MRSGLIEAIKPDRFADAREVDLDFQLFDAALVGQHGGMRNWLAPGHQVGQGIGKSKKPFFQFRPLEREEYVEQMLGGFDIARDQVGLKQVQPRGRAVAGRIIARRDQLDQLLDVAVHPQIARNGHQHIGAGSSGREHLFIDGEGSGQILGIELGARLRQLRHDPPGDGGLVRAGFVGL